MTNEILLSDRAGVVIRETLVPHLRKNFFRMANKPWLRYLGMNFADEGKTDGMYGSDAGRIQKVETMGVYNNQFKVVHQTTAFGGGVQAADEREALVNGGYYAQRSVASLKTIQGQFDITQQALDALDGQGGADAFVNEVVENSKGATHRMHKEMNRQTVGSIEGVLAYVDGATAASTTVTVKSNPTGTATNERVPTRHIHKGDVLWIGTKAQIEANSGMSTVTVSSVSSNTVFIATAAQTLTDGHRVVRQSVYSLTYTRYKELTGFAAQIANTGTVQTIDKATNAFFQSYSAAAAGGVLAVTDIDTMLHSIREYADNPADIFLMGNSKQWIRYASKLTTTKQIDYARFEGKLAGGLNGLTVYSPDGQIPFFIDNDVDDGVIYGVDPNAFMLGYTKMFNFLPKLRSQTTLEDFFAFYMTAEQAQLNAPSCGKITGITS